MKTNHGRLVGYVIGTYHGDFLSQVRKGDGCDWFAYAFHPDRAIRYRRFVEAQRMVEYIGKPGIEVLPIFDLGKQWRVEWPEEWNIAGAVA
jgi:hypothetical protein